MSIHFEICNLNKSGKNYIYAGAKKARKAKRSCNAWTAEHGMGMFYSTVGNATRAIKRLKAHSHSYQKHNFEIVQVEGDMVSHAAIR